MSDESSESSARIIVHKYGGSSVGTTDRVKKVARKIVDTRTRTGASLVVVVSAMGKTTNELLGLARDVTNDPSDRELDLLLSSGERISCSLLAMAIQELGCDAVALTGGQAGFVTNDSHNNARIVDIEPERVLEELGAGRVVVVAGYQGVDRDGEVTTLGRGGSDTSAVALASALDADTCCIYSDVDGVYTADPRVVPAARRIDEISYEEMQQMSWAGAGVLNARAVEWARRKNVELHARASFGNEEGTVIRALRRESRKPFRATSVAGHGTVLRIHDGGRPLGHGLGETLRTFLADHDVLSAEVDVDRGSVEFVLSTENIPELDAFVGAIQEQFGDAVRVDRRLGSATLIGAGIGDDPEVMARVRRTLTAGGIKIASEYDSSVSLTFVVPASEVNPALATLHREFIETVRNTESPAVFGRITQVEERRKEAS